MSIDRAKKIKLILFDVDGVLTDGSIWLFPAPAAGPQSTQEHRHRHADAPGFGIHSQTMIEAKGFNAHDGTAITLARLGGLKTGMITKRISEAVALRARDLKIDYLFQGAEHKSSVLDKILSETGLREEEVAYVGDDIIDLPIMQRCGLAIAVASSQRCMMGRSMMSSPTYATSSSRKPVSDRILSRTEDLCSAP